MTRVFGHVEGVSIGEVFLIRDLASEAGVHRPTQAGISGGDSDTPLLFCSRERSKRTSDKLNGNDRLEREER